MRWIPLSLLVACAAPAAQTPPPQPSIDVPAHTQAMIDAYRHVQATRAAAPVAAPQCPGEDNPAQRREKYLHAIDGCVDRTDAGDLLLELAPRAQWPALYAALDAPLAGVDRCISAGYTFFELSGALTTRIELAPDGAVKAVRTARDDAATPDIACCVRRELQQLRFPAPGRPIALEHVASYDPRSLQERYAGSLGKEDLRAVVQAHDAELRPCFDASVQQGLTHGGRVAVSFVIGPAGDVTRASVVEDTVGSPSAACCAVAKVRGWQFPKPNKGGPVHVTYPFDVQLGQP